MPKGKKSSASLEEKISLLLNKLASMEDRLVQLEEENKSLRQEKDRLNTLLESPAVLTAPNIRNVEELQNISAAEALILLVKNRWI